ncbi:hypothetical protein GA0061093_12669 [Rhodococcus qingshengii]|nr:hypothetical protein GA0061093_12669 [Rhodococcus qingshengii]
MNRHRPDGIVENVADKPEYSPTESQRIWRTSRGLSNPATRKQAPGEETSNVRTGCAPTKPELPAASTGETAAAGEDAGYWKDDRSSATRFHRRVLRLPRLNTCMPSVPAIFAT